MQKVVDFGKIASLSDDDSKKKWAWQQEKTSTTAGKARNKGKGKVGGEESRTVYLIEKQQEIYWKLKIYSYLCALFLE